MKDARQGRMGRRRTGIILIVAVLFLAPAGFLQGEEIVLSAAASLQDVLRDIIVGFEAKTGHEVVLNLGGSGNLAIQILKGAPADLFFSADAGRMDLLEREGLVRAEDRADVLSNQLAVVVPASSSARVTGPGDLARFRRIAIGQPESVPAGSYAVAFLESAGLWGQLRERIVPTLDVRAALAAVEAGHADAAIIYRTDALISRRVRIAWIVPVGGSPRIVYPLARVATSRRPAAGELSRHLLSPEVRAVYEKHGFEVLMAGRPGSD
jgi:molybdate transport system substrate-binding protein